MNKYNERMLKNVLEDIREENDIKLQQEAEEAASNPLFANNDDTDKRFYEAIKEIDKNKKRKQHRKTLIPLYSHYAEIRTYVQLVLFHLPLYWDHLFFSLIYPYIL